MWGTLGSVRRHSIVAKPSSKRTRKGIGVSRVCARRGIVAEIVDAFIEAAILLLAIGLLKEQPTKQGPHRERSDELVPSYSDPRGERALRSFRSRVKCIQQMIF
jgi:hypothetical protein